MFFAFQAGSDDKGLQMFGRCKLANRRIQLGTSDSNVSESVRRLWYRVQEYTQLNVR